MAILKTKKRRLRKTKKQNTQRHFQRYELKYYINEEQRNIILQNIKEFIEEDPFNTSLFKDDIPGYTVNSLYLDTHSQHYYYEKIDGLEIRKKYRFRVYQEDFNTDKIFMEIKRKNNEITLKDRIIVSKDEGLDVFDNCSLFYEIHKKDKDDIPVWEEFMFDKYMYNLNPFVNVIYFREAYFWNASTEVRLTFDHNIRYYNPFKQFLVKKKKHSEGWVNGIIFEIKIKGYMPFWLANIIRKLNLEVQSFSKYCNGVESLYHHLKLEQGV